MLKNAPKLTLELLESLKEKNYFYFWPFFKREMERDRLAVIVNEVCNRNNSKVGLGNGASDTNILKKKVSRTVREKKKQTVVYEEPTVKETKDEYVHKWEKEPVLEDPFNVTLTARRKALREKAVQLDDENGLFIYFMVFMTKCLSVDRSAVNRSTHI